MFEIKNKRLANIAELIEPCGCAADIGTDHAHLPIELILSGKCDKAVACDVRCGPLERAKKNIAANGLISFIETRLGYGLEPLAPGECGCIVIAGMGGLLISDILEKSKDTAAYADQLILQPNTCEYDLRKYLMRNGYEIIDERGIHEGRHFYLIIKCRAAGDAFSEKTDLEEKYAESRLFTGDIMPVRKSPEDIAYLKNLKYKTERILLGMSVAEAPDGRERVEKRERYEALADVLDCILREI